MLTIIVAQLAILIVMVCAYIVWRTRKESTRDRALAETLKISLERKYEMEQARLRNKR